MNVSYCLLCFDLNEHGFLYRVRFWIGRFVVSTLCMNVCVLSYMTCVDDDNDDEHDN